ncbi:hypothetical protein L6R52_25240 [Myxococcota bacterium]|nr:hypothetical protein [Myxococcota bacterium]
MRSLFLVLALLLPACGSEVVDVADAGAPDAATPDASACPRAACSDFDLSATRYDAASHVLTITLAETAPEVASGSVSFSAARMGMAPSTYSAVLTVAGRTLTADLSRWLVADTVFFGQLSLTLVSSCGATSVVGNLGVTTGTSADGITVTAFQCL